MSSATNYILFLKSITKYLYQIGGPILMCVGSISCILSLIVFTKKALRKNPCSIYFISYNIANFILMYSSIFTVALSAGYGISPSTYNLAFCRYNLYMAILIDILSSSYLVLASIDRMLVTSVNVRVRQRSTRRIAYISIISITIFWILFHSHILFTAAIIQAAPNTFVCNLPPGPDLILHSYYSLIVKAILIPLLMIIFGVIALKNIRRLRSVAAAPVLTNTGTTVKNQSQSSHAKDRQFCLMLFIDITAYIIFSSMLSAINMYQQITQYNVKSSSQTQFELFLKTTAVFINYISICIGCYTNIYISKTFRSNIKDIILCR
ncbi:unnamed protein product [Adineta steineri]|uniref:G-protein coupled receptors family 1 profile domain-containing protein n=1 Tax=Adineta steineri TaxID=433720 RepID=A0A814VW09_9BILA|nr:unnamed protein product [Adineta steineri]CAF1448461.1 unnamed protein product [Adineta steineri]